MPIVETIRFKDGYLWVSLTFMGVLFLGGLSSTFPRRNQDLIDITAVGSRCHWYGAHRRWLLIVDGFAFSIGSHFRIVLAVIGHERSWF